MAIGEALLRRKKQFIRAPTKLSSPHRVVDQCPKQDHHGSPQLLIVSEEHFAVTILGPVLDLKALPIDNRIRQTSAFCLVKHAWFHLQLLLKFLPCHRNQFSHFHTAPVNYIDALDRPHTILILLEAFLLQNFGVIVVEDGWEIALGPLTSVKPVVVEFSPDDVGQTAVEIVLETEVSPAERG